MANKTKLTWLNPTQNTDGTAYNPVTENAGYELAFDASDVPVVTLPFALGTEFDMKDLDAYKALKAGSHQVKLRVVTKGGTQSAYAASTFLLVGTPAAPANLVVV